MLRHSLATLGLLLAALSSAGAQDAGQRVAPVYEYVSAGASQMALSITTNTGLTVPAFATMAQICVEGAAVRYRDDGTAPTASVGMPVSNGACFQYAGNLASLAFTAQSGSPTIDVSYYKNR